MPSSVVKSFAKKTGKSEEEVEKLWNEAKAVAKKDGYSEDDENFYAIVVSILKRMLKLNESQKLTKSVLQKMKEGEMKIKTFKEFVNEEFTEQDELKTSNKDDEINESYEDGVVNYLYESLLYLNKATKIAKKLKDGSRLNKTLMDIANEIEEEIMFIEKGEYS